MTTPTPTRATGSHFYKYSSPDHLGRLYILANGCVVAFHRRNLLTGQKTDFDLQMNLEHR